MFEDPEVLRSYKERIQKAELLTKQVNYLKGLAEKLEDEEALVSIYITDKHKVLSDLHGYSTKEEVSFLMKGVIVEALANLIQLTEEDLREV
jgi:hypothetical protein